MTANMNVRLQSNGGKEFRSSIEVPCMPAHLLLFVDVVPCFSFCREILELSRDLEWLTAKDEKSTTSEANHDASALEDLPALQFSPGSWIRSTTTPGTSRSTQRRCKPADKLIRRKGGKHKPCHGSLAAPQTPPVVGVKSKSRVDN